MVQPWIFIDENGTFELPNPHQTSYLYFPLVNEAGLMSSVTPTLNGDIKSGQHTFLTLPVSVEDLHNSRSSRNFWVYVDGAGAWSATGSSAAQISHHCTGPEDDQVILQAGLLWQKVIRTNQKLGLKAEATSLIPPSPDQVELLQIRFTNISDHPVQMTPTAAIPIYGRSADNLRDHRHVTSLLHRIACNEYGIIVCPTLSFDERGHHSNQTSYFVQGVEGDGIPPLGYFPMVEEFIGEGGRLDWPEAAVRPLRNCVPAGESFAGFEALGGLRFRDRTLLPGERWSYRLILGMSENDREFAHFIDSYGSQQKFDNWLEKTKEYWQRKLETLSFQTGDSQFDQWLKWVSIQPVLRRLFGNSFLPYHDYGRGGRGWRDLWQDILTLLIMETGPVDQLLFGNFAGVRLDGSNATIIGSQPGEFKADRNNIPRVWMDHGAWPLIATQLYIDQTGDLEFLLRDQVYFKDRWVKRAQAVDLDWEPDQGTQQRTQTGEVYQGSVLEHLLIQHLTAFFNVGEHNQIRLEGADWNDGMDMAARRGESVAFTAFYAENFNQLGKLVLALQEKGVEKVVFMEELLLLLDPVRNRIDPGSIIARQQRLADYFNRIRHTISGKKILIQTKDLALDLFSKASALVENIRTQEWLTDREGNGWFNGYYDNDGQRLEGVYPDGVRMTLTGQVFPLMGGVATDVQAGQIIQSIERYLVDDKTGGYRLNTDFKSVLLNMGRCFGFAYGHKENGAVFSHMAVMYAYALYQRRFIRQAYRVMDSLYQQSANFEISRMYPGIPEYFNAKGRGVYPYLTGSASWYLYTLLTQAFGVQGYFGDLVLSPKLVPEQFDANGEAAVHTWFSGRQIEVRYINPTRREPGDYRINRVAIDDRELPLNSLAVEYWISKQSIAGLEPGKLHSITVWLAANGE